MKSSHIVVLCTEIKILHFIYIYFCLYSEPLKAERGRSPRNSGRKQKLNSRSGSVGREGFESKDALPSLDLKDTAFPSGGRSLDG